MNQDVPFKKLQKNLLVGQTSCEKIVQDFLRQITKHNNLNAFSEVFNQEVVINAKRIDQKINTKKAGKLAGLVVGVKDNLCFKNHISSTGSKILKDFHSPYTSSAIQSLIDEDAIIIGRQNCDEFGMGSSNEHSTYGPTINGIGEKRVPGGSSGGSAVAVQMNMCHVSIASDTGGSVRQPASFCGVLGLKPTYSRISRYGLIAYASSFDCIGIIGRNPYEMALCLESMAGEDINDSTSSKVSVPNYSQQMKLREKVKIAVINQTIDQKLINPEVISNTQNVLNNLNTNHKVDYVDFSHLEYILPAYYILTTAEASSNLSRFEGIRYGIRSNEKTLTETYTKSRMLGFGKEVKKRILLGTFVLSANYYDAYYEKAQKIRALIKKETDDLLTNYDFIIGPTSPHTAFLIGEKSHSLQMYLSDLLTVHASITGLPAISVPVENDSQGLPVGIQLMSKEFNESALLSLANYILQPN